MIIHLSRLTASRCSLGLLSDVVPLDTNDAEIKPNENREDHLEYSLKHCRKRNFRVEDGEEYNREVSEHVGGNHHEAAGD